jgi:NAD(P)-dependent dehydrogenase (short-subunit alcohol dehydrogenase family)
MIAEPRPKCVLITGTTSGIGRALLEHYHALGVRVVAVNRRRDPGLQHQFPRVRFELVDVRSARSVRELIARLIEAQQIPDTFILNAGINRIDNDEAFDLEAFQSVIDTNLYGALHFVAELTRLPRSPERRHLIAISSMANYVGNPYGLGYTVSKRALTTCFDTWSRMYVGTDLVFQQLMLGPVRTEIFTMDAQFPGWMVWIKRLFSGSLEGTVRAVSRLSRGRSRRHFYPWRSLPLYAAMRLFRGAIPGFFHGRSALDGRARRPAPGTTSTERPERLSITERSRHTRTHVDE